MRRRIRVLAGALALFATTVSVSGSVLAPACAAAMTEFAVPSGSVSGFATIGPAPAAMGHGTLCDERTDGCSCPAEGAVAQGCTSAASLPSRISLEAPPAPWRALTTLSEITLSPPLLARIHFHPPRA